MQLKNDAFIFSSLSAVGTFPCKRWDTVQISISIIKLFLTYHSGSSVCVLQGTRSTYADIWRGHAQSGDVPTKCQSTLWSRWYHQLKDHYGHHRSKWFFCVLLNWQFVLSVLKKIGDSCMHVCVMSAHRLTVCLVCLKKDRGFLYACVCHVSSLSCCELTLCLKEQLVHTSWHPLKSAGTEWFLEPFL